MDQGGAGGGDTAGIDEAEGEGVNGVKCDARVTAWALHLSALHFAGGRRTLCRADVSDRSRCGWSTPPRRAETATSSSACCRRRWRKCSATTSSSTTAPGAGGSGGRGDHREEPARRLHDGDRGRQLHDQSFARAQAALRHGEGLHAARPHRRRSHGGGRSSVAAGEDPEGAHRARAARGPDSSTIRARDPARSVTCRASCSTRLRRSSSCTSRTRA